MTVLRLIVLAMLVIAANAAGAAAQSPSPLPPGMTQVQFDTMVDAISKAVAEKLKAEQGTAASAPAPPAPAPSAQTDTPGSLVAGPLAAFFAKAERVFHTGPAIGANLAAIRRLLDESDRGGRSIPRFLLLLLAVAVLSLAVEPALRKALGGVRRRIAGGASAGRGMASLVNLGLLVLIDGVAVLAFWIVASIALAALFAGPAEQDRFAATVLVRLFWWRVFVLGLRSLLQPDLPPARLIPIPDREARLAYRWLSAVLLVIDVGAVVNGLLAAAGIAADSMVTGRVVVAPVGVGIFTWFAVRSAEVVRSWCYGLVGAPRVYRLIGDHWVAIVVPFCLFMGLIMVYGAISELADVATALRQTIVLLIVLLIFETLLSAVLQRVRSTSGRPAPDRTAKGERAKLWDVLARCLRVAVLLGVAVVLANVWAVHVLGLVDASQWSSLGVQLRTAGATLFAAFVVWEILKVVTDPYVVSKADLAVSNASRLSTLLPLLRATLGIVIGLVAVLIVLADLGVNITPLLAGASILGLAVSFGSQALVKDIVSGIFYLTDDAFRVGEYIECGQTRGVVEGFTLRSIRLRHPTGQLHTIPFGDLGKIANFSRDWAIVKYDFSFPRDVDIDKVRRVVDGVDDALKGDADYGRKILEPLKAQGVVSVSDNALVIQFRFAAEPGNPEAIQRDVMRRLMQAFLAQDVKFGSATVVG